MLCYYVNLICSLPLWTETVHVRERENVSAYNEGRSFIYWWQRWDLNPRLRGMLDTWETFNYSGDPKSDHLKTAIIQKTDFLNGGGRRGPVGLFVMYNLSHGAKG